MKIRFNFAGFILIALLFTPMKAYAKEGKLFNPLTDLCWKCMFPLKVAGYNVAMGGEKSLSSDNKEKLCRCPAEKKELPTLVGVPISFNEPTRLIDVTRIPYNMVGIGGLKLKKASKNYKATYTAGGPTRYASYHVHVYEYPVLNLLEMANDLVCTEFGNKSFDIEIPYMSEFDIYWDNEKVLNYLNPDMFLFANPVAQVSCAPSCIASTLQRPVDELFWCAGCQGSLYPLFGFVAEFIGPLQASLLLLQRVIVKLHQTGQLKTYPDGKYCKKEHMLRPKRGQYKTQLVYPVATTKGPCQALGKTEVFWGAGKSFPVNGEEFCFLLWTERRCCLDPIKAGLELGKL